MALSPFFELIFLAVRVFVLCQIVLTGVRRRNRKKRKTAPRARTKEEKCATRWCRNRRALKTDGYFLKFCWKCHSRQLKERCPWTYVLNMLRHSAHKRNLPFTLTVASFKAWCAQTHYLERRGNKPGDLTIDRIDWNEGYHVWNIRTITHEENSKQGVDNTPRESRVSDHWIPERIEEQARDPEIEPF